MSKDEGIILCLKVEESNLNDGPIVEDSHNKLRTRATPLCNQNSSSPFQEKMEKTPGSSKEEISSKEKHTFHEVNVEDSEISEIEEDQCVPNGIKCIECFICGLRMTKIYNLRKHMPLHANEDSISLDNIETAEIYSVLNPHMRKIDKNIVRNFIIGEIKAKRYSQFYGILNEAGVELHISDSETDSDSCDLNVIPQNTYKCEICKKNFDRRYKILFHQKTAHMKCDLYIECDYCMKKFVCMNLLIHHLKTQCENDEKPITCVDRFKTFLLKANLDQFANLAQARAQRKIRRLTAAPKTYTCEICNKTFTRSEHLTRHKAVHLPEELKFECPVCNRRFNRKDNMRSHMRVHIDEGERDTEERIILCSYCGHSFASKSNYVVHMRRHTGEKPYKCDVCGKGFPKSTDLNSHKITHTGEKNFICSICNKAFARSTVLSKHMRIHAGPYYCTFCDKSFNKPSELTQHVRIHTGGKLCVCLTCSDSFGTKSELDAHFLATGHDNQRRHTHNKDATIIKPTDLATEEISKLTVFRPVDTTAHNLEDSLCGELPNNNVDPLEIHEGAARNKYRKKVSKNVNNREMSPVSLSITPDQGENVDLKFMSSIDKFDY